MSEVVLSSNRLDMPFQPTKRNAAQRLWINFAGWTCIALGIIGGFIPVMQGWMFIVAGLLILSREYEWAHNLLHKLRTRFPKFAAAMDRSKESAERFMNKMLRRNPQQ